ncbi:MAG: superinfection immunity protein [Alphaproteobacteria bacterium]|nr:superinfection immunity protein [Alphaproteobacteria bacterium]MBV9861856.1 superinfection immunity protein [Alphaproteobacteria bacterium]
MLGNTTSVIVLIVIVVIYMLPALIAFARDHPRRAAITLLDILFGWTLIGWLLLFLWAALTETEAVEVR